MLDRAKLPEFVGELSGEELLAVGVGLTAALALDEVRPLPSSPS